MRVILILAVAATAAAQPVSYTREIAPILAMNCHLCHGANPESKAGGLSTRTWADLMKGGNLGPAVVVDDPEASALYQFVSGARGPAHRMPLGGAPLEPVQIEMLRRWIVEGARPDTDDTKQYRLTLPSVRLERGTPTAIRARVPYSAYVELEASDAHRKVLYLDGGAVRNDRGVAAIGAPNHWIAWNLRRAPHWPGRVRITLVISHAMQEPLHAELAIGR